MIRRLRGALRRLWYLVDTGAAPHRHADLFPYWDADRRRRQLAAFELDRADLFAHGISEVGK